MMDLFQRALRLDPRSWKAPAYLIEQAIHRTANEAASPERIWGVDRFHYFPVTRLNRIGPTEVALEAGQRLSTLREVRRGV